MKEKKRENGYQSDVCPVSRPCPVHSELWFMISEMHANERKPSLYSILALCVAPRKRKWYHARSNQTPP